MQAELLFVVLISGREGMLKPRVKLLCSVTDAGPYYGLHFVSPFDL